MATAFRHMGLGTPLQVMDFASRRMGELKRAIEDWENEYEMWAKVDSRPGDATPAAARGHLRARQRELSEAMAAAKHEQGILTELHAACQPCAACGGSGRYSIQNEDGSKSYPCKVCGGSGTSVK